MKSGWKESEYLPKDWIFKDTARNSTSKVLVLSAEGIKFESYLSVKEFMQSSEQFNENDVDNIQKLCDENGKRRRKSETVWKPCEMLPEGWKIMITKTQKHFLTPDGIRIVGRRAALLHMIREDFREEDVKIMRKSMEEDGWRESTYLPKDWIYRDTANSSYSGVAILSAEGVIFESYLSVKEFMELSDKFDETDVQNIGKLSDEAARQRRKCETGWEQSKTLPRGWKIMITASQKFFLTPDGLRIAGRKSALQHMIREQYPTEEIHIMRKSMTEDGWSESEFLPKDWIYRDTRGVKGGVKVLSAEGVVFDSYLNVKEFMESSENFDDNDISDINKLCEEAGKLRRRNGNNWTESKSLPRGWKMRALTGGKKFFLDPSGEQFSGRKAALIHMVQQKYEDGDTQKMRDSMCEDGWEVSDLLPKGWIFKVTYSTGSSNVCLISQNGLVFESYTGVKEYMKQSKFYREEDMKKVDQLSESNAAKRMQQLRQFMDESKGGSKLAENGGSKVEDDHEQSKRVRYHNWIEAEDLPDGWKTKSNGKAFLSPEGKLLVGTLSILKHFAERQQINEINEYMKKKGWKMSKLLPKNWRYQKSKRDSNSMSFLTSTGDVLRGSVQAKAMIEAMGGSNSRESRNFEIFKNIRMGEQRSTAYTWNGNDPTLPKGWKSRVAEGSSTKIFFISPENEQFVNRASILRQISGSGTYDAEDLTLVRKSLELDGWEYHPALPNDWRWVFVILTNIFL